MKTFKTTFPVTYAIELKPAEIAKGVFAVRAQNGNRNLEQKQTKETKGINLVKKTQTPMMGLHGSSETRTKFWIFSATSAPLREIQFQTHLIYGT